MSPATTNALNTLTLEAEAVLTTLSDVLDTETIAVRMSDFKTFRSVQNDKNALFARYKTLMETLSKKAKHLREAPEATAERLRKTVHRFHKSVADNTVALEAGSRSIQRITDRIVKGARETAQANRQSYNYSGQTKHNSPLPVSIRVDEVL